MPGRRRNRKRGPAGSANATWKLKNQFLAWFCLLGLFLCSTFREVRKPEGSFQQLWTSREVPADLRDPPFG